MANLTMRPEINDYPLKSPRTPIHLRETIDKPYDTVLQNIREADP